MHTIVRQHPNAVRGERLNPRGSSKLSIRPICQSKPTLALASHTMLLTCETPWLTKTPLRPFDSCSVPVCSIGTCWSLSDNASGSRRSVNVKGCFQTVPNLYSSSYNRLDVYYTYSLTYNLLCYPGLERVS